MHWRKDLSFLITVGVLLLISACKSGPAPTSTSTSTPVVVTPSPPPTSTPVLITSEELAVSSPNGNIQAVFIIKDGAPYYRVSYAGRDVIKPSRLGFKFKTADPLDQNLVVVDSAAQGIDETWTQPWGEVKDIRNHYNELRVTLEESAQAQRRMAVVFRVYDDGLGFRYELPQQETLADFEIMDEETEFVLAGNHRAWWIQAYKKERYELLYQKSPINDMWIVHTPLTMETSDGLFLSIHEAALTDYAAMNLKAAGNNTLQCDLVPWSDGVKVRASTPHRTPWRTLQIAESAGDLITSYLILNLNEPNQLGDVAWIHPLKYVGLWWAMHIDKYTWVPGLRHGATTENATQYIDFAAKHGFDGVLVEGWNVGWTDIPDYGGEHFYFTGSYPDFDLKAVAAYAADKGVKLIGHHETFGAVANYEWQMEQALQLYHDLGVEVVKTGYACGDKCIRRYDQAGEFVGYEWHHGQYMIEHYQRVVETAARYHIMLNVHEPIKDTGLRRTFPNLLSSEGARGQEYDAWSADGGNPPQHTTVLPFTRLLAGPMDFTPGAFDLFFDEYRPRNRVNTTLAKQLALYVVIYSPFQMASDLPENYEGQAAFKFIEDVPVDWQDTQVLNGQIGDYVTIVRKDRNSQDWYLGSITDEHGRALEAPLTFLDADRTYVAEFYADAADADWQHNPLAMHIYAALVDQDTTLELELAPGGGQAIRIRPATQQEINLILPYQP